MPNFQTGEIPPASAFTEGGGLIHYKIRIVRLSRRPNRGRLAARGLDQLRLRLGLCAPPRHEASPGRGGPRRARQRPRRVAC